MTDGGGVPRTLGLIGPLAAALAGVPAGHLVDHVGAHRMRTIGLAGLAAGCCVLSLLPASFGIAGYLMPIVLITVNYALFQAANSTVIMMGTRTDRRGVVSGMLNLSRNLGLITGAAVMGAVFAHASAAVDVTTANPAAVAAGMRGTFAVAATLIGVALAISAAARAFPRPGGADVLAGAPDRA